MVEWLVCRPWCGRPGFKPAGKQFEVFVIFCLFLEKKPKIAKKKNLLFLAPFSLHVSLSPACSTSHILAVPFQVCLSLTFRFITPVLCISGHLFFPLFHLLSCAIQATVSCLSLVSPQLLCLPGHCRFTSRLCWFKPAEVGFESTPLP